MASDQLLPCYNRSCGLVFDPAKNTEDSCLHHPGFPVFHDAYKKWSCCNKKTTDFTEFLNFKGCTRSYHSNVKPPEPPKPSNKDSDEVQRIPPPLESQKTLVRPDSGLPMERLPTSVAASLKTVLETLQGEKKNDNDDSDQAVKLDTPCHNKGCRVVYKGEETNAETCLYHSGDAIFHEGMKYWSCCGRKTSDFNTFLQQVGCTTGKHKWHPDRDSEENVKCRYDWHQTGKTVVVSVYSKNPFPDLSFVEANPVKLRIHITFGEKRSVFDLEIPLFGVVNVADSLVTFFQNKVEIKLTKEGPPLSWKTLAHVQKENALPQINSISLQDDSQR